MDNYSYFSGAIRFTSILMIIDVILIFHFFIAWYISYKKTGWAVDPWNLALLFSYFFPFLVLYPFSSSIFNVVSVGAHVLDIQGSINEAYLVSLTGYMSFFLGSRIFKIFKTNTAIYWVFVLPFKKTIAQTYKNVLLNKDVCKVVFLIYCGALAFMLFAAFKAGSFNNPRAYFYKNEGIRAYYNFTVSLSGIVSGVFIARIFQFNLLSDKIYLGLFMLVNLFVGSRAFALGPLVGIFTLVVFLIWKGRFKIKQMIIYGCFIFGLLAVLTSFRAGKSSTQDPKAIKSTYGSFISETLYGNTFSDLRDFAWCLSAWDHEYFYGKTYFSAFISFIPTTFSSYRNEYNIGRITARLGGFSPSEHPGLRPGMFGESYLNFGIVGVFFIGIILGYGTRYSDFKAKVAANSNNKLEYFIAGVGTIFIGNLSITAGFFSLYVFVIIIALLFFLKLVLLAFKQLKI